MTGAGPRRAGRRTDALTRERILSAAIAILDTGGSGGLTLRTLMSRLSTGSGAVYHHVATMDELRAMAADDVLRRRLPDPPADTEPTAALRQTVLAIYDVIESHSWFAAQLADDPVQPAAVRIWKAIGSPLRRLEHCSVDAAVGGSVLFRFILGSAAQHVSGPARLSSDVDRATYLAATAERLRGSDPDPLVGRIADAVAEHDDRHQFLTGLDVILRGLAG